MCSKCLLCRRHGAKSNVRWCSNIEMGDGANAGLIAPQEKRSALNTTPTTLEWFVERVFAPAYLQTT